MKIIRLFMQEFQQHDVQELNRILFSAIESSLLGTSGEQLIAKLYHGISVQQVLTFVCYLKKKKLLSKCNLFTDKVHFDIAKLYHGISIDATGIDKTLTYQLLIKALTFAFIM